MRRPLNNIRIWLVWNKLKRQIREQLTPENAVHWLQLAGLALSFGLMLYEFLSFFWAFRHIFGAR